MDEFVSCSYCYGVGHDKYECPDLLESEEEPLKLGEEAF